MTFDRIDHLVTQQGFCFQAWDDRYSKGVWAALGLWEDQVDIVRDLSSAGDLDMIPAMDYVFSADWLPYVTGRTLADAMQKLEERLAMLPPDQLHRNSQWAGLVHNALDALGGATAGRSWYDDKKPQALAELPATFELAVTTREMIVYVHQRFWIALRRHEKLQNWLLGLVLQLGCFGFITWYFLKAAMVFDWNLLLTGGALFAVLVCIFTVSYRQYGKLVLDIRQGRK